MHLSIPGGFPGFGNPASQSADHAAENNRSIDLHRSAPVNNAPPAADRLNVPKPISREVTLQKKLIASLKGNFSVSVPTVAVGIATSAATAAIRQGDVASSAGQAALASGLEFAVGLNVSALATAVLHHTGLSSRISAERTEKEQLDQTMLISAVMNVGSGLLGGIGYDLAAKAATHHEITRGVLLESVIDQVISKFVAAGAIGAGAALMYKHNQHFRNIVDTTLSSILKEKRRHAKQDGHDEANARPENWEAKVEEGRACGPSTHANVAERQ